MQLTTLATLSLFLGLPLTAVAQSACTGATIADNKNLDESVAFNFNKQRNIYETVLEMGAAAARVPGLNINNYSDDKKKFCLASEPSTPQIVSCFELGPHSTCAVSDYYGKPFRLDTYLI
ncbi:uncharacterized protein CTRU02_213864 [Colletotrichum truncatum]|uniref:Uncharacterized protein n=1 Tax=Colletotrichum truncatum TaxID=5467 RepID=A0ACC3YGV7_COLTU|nr:uncharacterized protein CTRU02_12886 [Colletotrichum truncatum]KAF6784119.1 hypothetical protein CTRU02_12886 [Colletotrichum truncatum]